MLGPAVGLSWYDGGAWVYWRSGSSSESRVGAGVYLAFDMVSIVGCKACRCIEEVTLGWTREVAGGRVAQSNEVRRGSTHYGGA